MHHMECSRAMAGTMTPEFLEGKVDANGTTFQEAANAVGYGGESHKVKPHGISKMLEATHYYQEHCLDRVAFSHDNQLHFLPFCMAIPTIPCKSQCFCTLIFGAFGP